MKKRRIALGVSGLLLIVFCWVTAYGVKAICTGSQSGMSCQGQCSCTGDGGGDGMEPCEFYCTNQHNWFWCGPHTSPECALEGPI